MLVLSRKQSDAIVINGTIRIQVLRIKRHAICLGIDAPREVSILRSELEAVAADQPESAGDGDLDPRKRVTTNAGWS
jgi:carbon storage regulator